MTANPASDELVAEIRAGLEGVTRGPWIKSGVRSAYPERAKATWIGPDGGGIIGVLFSDLTPDEYRASMADATWVWLAQPGNIAALLARLEAAEAERDRLAAVVAEARTNLETVQRTIATKAPPGAPWAHEAMSMLSAMLGDRHAVTGEVKTHPAIKDDATRAWQKHGEVG